MGKDLKIGIAILVVVLAACITYTAFYLVLGLQRVDSFNTLLLGLAWVVAVVVVAWFIRSRKRRSEELVRRYYISSDWVYNHEIGYAPIRKVTPDGDAYEFITFAAESLAEMSYGFEVADPPVDFQPELVVVSPRFRFHRSGDGIVIDTWAGNLQRVVRKPSGGRSLKRVGSFSNAKQLARLLDEEGIFQPVTETGDFDVAGGIGYANAAAREVEYAEIEARALADLTEALGGVK